MQQQGPNNQNTGFLDFKTIIAIVLVGLVWLGWQNHLQKKYPDAYKQKAQNAETVTGEATETQEVAEQTKSKDLNVSQNSNEPSLPATQAIENEGVVEEKITVHEDHAWKLEFSSRGMGIKSIALKKYTDREDQPIIVGDSSKQLPFETNLIGRNRPLHFDIKQIAAFEYVGTARVDGLDILKRVTIDPGKFTLETDVTVNGLSDRFAGVVSYLSEKIVKGEEHFFLPSFNQQDLYVAHGSTDSREFIVADQPFQELFSQVRIFSLGTNYFASSIVDRSSVIPDLKVAVDQKAEIVSGVLSHQVLNRTGSFNVSYTGFAGPKDVNVLEKVDTGMTEIIDLGWFSSLAVILFNILEWFYSIVGNYGVAIILLTLLVRTVILPLNLMSFKSMKSMQVIQPRIKALREKYKDDQQTLNREMMALMKENKVNPMGGCLPMLLQFPVFIALYRVFGSSIDLYKAPFAFWISDLSLKDPYYILPILMGVSFYFQTKLTPSTMDPTQQKIMMFMPVMFALFMAGLPSALTLYMFVSTLFGIAQQLYFMRDKKKENSIVPAKQVKI